MKKRTFLLFVLVLIITGVSCKKDKNKSSSGSSATACTISTPASGDAPFNSIVNDTIHDDLFGRFNAYNISWRPTVNCWNIRVIASRTLYMMDLGIYLGGTAVPTSSGVYTLRPDTTFLGSGEACIIDFSGLTDESPSTWRKLFSTAGQLHIDCNNGDIHATFNIAQGMADTTLLNVAIAGDITCHR